MLATTFAAIADPRDPRRITWELPAVLMSAFAMLFFQHPSLLEYQRRMQKRTGVSNLERVFGVEELPSDTQMRELLDGVPTEPLRRVLPQIFEQMRRVGWTTRFVTEVGGETYYPTVLDGSEYFHSTQIHCPSCLHQRQANGETHYSHVVVAATVTRAGVTRLCRWMPRKCAIRMGRRSKTVNSPRPSGWENGSARNIGSYPWVSSATISMGMPVY